LPDAVESLRIIVGLSSCQPLKSGLLVDDYLHLLQVGLYFTRDGGPIRRTAVAFERCQQALVFLIKKIELLFTLRLISHHVRHRILVIVQIRQHLLKIRYSLLISSRRPSGRTTVVT
jgi:hypothetical protein